MRSPSTLQAGTCLLALCVCGALKAGEEKPPPENAETVLAGMRKAMDGAGSLCSDYVQERRLDLFEKPLRSEGVMVFAKPGQVRWETTVPYKAILLTDGKSAAQFEWTDGRWKKLNAGQSQILRKVMGEIASIHQGEAEELKKEHEIAASRDADGVTLTMTPRARDARAMLASIEIRLPADLSTVRSVVLREPNGDFTKIAFGNERRNVELPDKTFDVEAPAELKKIQDAANTPGKK